MKCKRYSDQFILYSFMIKLKQIYECKLFKNKHLHQVSAWFDLTQVRDLWLKHWQILNSTIAGETLWRLISTLHFKLFKSLASNRVNTIKASLLSSLGLSLSSSQRKIHNPIQLAGTMKVSVSFYNMSQQYNNAPFQLHINCQCWGPIRENHAA